MTCPIKSITGEDLQGPYWCRLLETASIQIHTSMCAYLDMCAAVQAHACSLPSGDIRGHVP